MDFKGIEGGQKQGSRINPVSWVKQNLRARTSPTFQQILSSEIPGHESWFLFI